MSQWITWLAMALFFSGAALVVGAMTVGTVSWRSCAIALFRGSFQRRVDYTSAGWKCYWTGVVLGVSGVGLIVLGRFAGI